MKKVTVALTDLKETFYVRTAIDHEHVSYLKGLVQTGVDLPRIRVNVDTMEIVDGRHRKAAFEEIGFVDVECDAQKYASRAEMIADALKSNVGGSLPPSPADINHTMELMLSDGMKRKEIIVLISKRVGFPAKLVQKHLDDVQSNLCKVRMRRAISAVVDGGAKVEEAAVAFNVKPEALKQQLLASLDGAEVGKKSDIRQLNAYLGSKITSLNMSFSQSLNRFTRDLRDGLVTNAEAVEVANKLEKLAKRCEKVLLDWANRLKTQAGTSENAQILTSKRAEKSVKKKTRKPKAKNGDDKTSVSKALSRMGL